LPQVRSLPQRQRVVRSPLAPEPPPPFSPRTRERTGGYRSQAKGSTYQAGRRSPDWLKIKARLQQEFAIGGLTEGKGSRKHFGALLSGAYRDGKFRYFGHSGSGFSEKGLKETFGATETAIYDQIPVRESAQNPRKEPVS
jgi:ATP-dependent DNA ligase